MKEQNKTPEEELTEVETGNLPKKEFKVMIVKMIKELGRRTDALSRQLEFFNKELKKYKEQLNREEEYNNLNEKYTRSNQNQD